MTIQEHINNLNKKGTNREKERKEIYNSIKEMEITSNLIVVEIRHNVVIVTN